MEKTIKMVQRLKRRQIKDYKFDVKDLNSLRLLVDSSYRLEVLVVYPDGNSTSHKYPLRKIDEALLMFHRRILFANEVGLRVRVQVRLLTSELFNNVTLFDHVS